MNKFESNDTRYDKRWEQIGDDVKKYGPFSRHVRRLLLIELSKLSFETVLDVGCGPGVLLHDIQNQFPNAGIFGLDFSSYVITTAMNNLPNGNFFVLDITREVLPRKFDVVICSEVLEHIEDDETAICHLEKMTEHYLLISTPQGSMRNFEKSGVGHVRNYSKEELISKLESNNFNIRNIIEWGFPFYSPLYRDFLDLIKDKGTRGEFGTSRIIISQLLYYLFLLNSSKRGDELVILAQSKSHRD
jgi:2-polyprenyl-3-methyl-5-hydroxy-6-metoxy-1,4-benzoquinol methylase